MLKYELYIFVEIFLVKGFGNWYCNFVNVFGYL